MWPEFVNMLRTLFATRRNVKSSYFLITLARVIIANGDKNNLVFLFSPCVCVPFGFTCPGVPSNRFGRPRTVRRQQTKAHEPSVNEHGPPKHKGWYFTQAVVSNREKNVSRKALHLPQQRASLKFTSLCLLSPLFPFTRAIRQSLSRLWQAPSA